MGHPHRDRELEGTLKLHEFMREAEELQSWLARQTEAARGGESLGEDHEHVLVRRGLGQGGALRQNAGGERGHGSGALAKDRCLSGVGRCCTCLTPHR